VNHGQVTDDLMWPWVVTRIYLNLNISKTFLCSGSASLEHVRVKWHDVTLKGQGQDPIH